MVMPPLITLRHAARSCPKRSPHQDRMSLPHVWTVGNPHPILVLVTSRELQRHRADFMTRIGSASSCRLTHRFIGHMLQKSNGSCVAYSDTYLSPFCKGLLFTHSQHFDLLRPDETLAIFWYLLRRSAYRLEFSRTVHCPLWSSSEEPEIM